MIEHGVHLHHHERRHAELGDGDQLHYAKYVRMAYEEAPRSELTPPGVPATGPNRISTVTRDFPITGFKMEPKPTPLDRSNEMRNILGGVPMVPDAFAPDGSYAGRAYVDDLVFLLGLSGFVGTHTAGGALIATPDKTTVVGVNALNSAIINVVSTAGFPSAGNIILAGVSIAYTGITATSFTGCAAHAATAGGEVITGNAPTATHLWSFVKQAGITPQTAQAIAAYDDEGVYLQGNGFAISDWTLDAGGNFGATLMGLYMASIANPAITPSLATQAILPLLRGGLTLNWLAGGAQASDFSLAYTQGLQHWYSMGNGNSLFPDVLEVGDAQARMTGTIPKRRMNPNDWAALIATSTFAAVANWNGRSNIGATNIPYQAWVEMPSCQLLGATFDELNQNRRHGASYPFWAAYDETAGYDVKITLLGSLAAAVTYV